MVGRAVSSGQEELAKKCAGYDARAATLAADPKQAADPDEQTTAGEKLQTVLRETLKENATAEVLKVEGCSGLTWLAVLAALGSATARAMVSPEAKRRKKALPAPGVALLSEATEDARKLRNRVATACDTNGADPQEAGHRRDTVLGGRTIENSRAGWAKEMTFAAEGIETLKKEGKASAGLLRLQPKVVAMAQELRDAQAGAGGRPSRDFEWTPVALVPAKALQLAIGDFIDWAAGVADDRAQGSILKAVRQRRRGDTAASGDGQAAPGADGAAAAPEGGETKSPEK